jgi:hypothetical protein
MAVALQLAAIQPTALFGMRSDLVAVQPIEEETVADR